MQANSSIPTLVLPAPAKLNLFLQVVGKRPDGYHLLQSVMQCVDLQDTLHFTTQTACEITFSCSVTKLQNAQNLVVRAAQRLQQQFGIQQGVHIYLDKKIPWGSGLGGGSSDAATTLHALNYLWNLQLSQMELEKIGLELGADVPFFVRGETVWMEGIGDLFHPTTVPSAWYVILVPACIVNTADVFRAKNLNYSPVMRPIQNFMLGSGRNDLEPITLQKYPLVAQGLRHLQTHAANARMSGSGGALFSYCADEETARDLAKKIPPTFAAYVARGLPQSPLKTKLPIGSE